MVGLRPIAQYSLYVKNYMYCAIQVEVSHQYGLSVKRNQQVEIGNLISTFSGLINPLFIIFVFTLTELEIEWITFIATDQVEPLLKKHN